MQTIAQPAKKFKLIVKSAMKKDNAFYVSKDFILIQFSNVFKLVRQFK